MRGSWGEEWTSKGNFFPSHKCLLPGAGLGWWAQGGSHGDRVNWSLPNWSSRLSLPRKSSWNCSRLQIFRGKFHKPSVNLPLGWTLTYLGLWAISELGGERVTGEKKGMETNTLFSLLPRVDSNFILEEAKAKVLDYFRFSVARLIAMEHLRISWIVSKFYIWLNTLLKKQHFSFTLWHQLVFTFRLFSNLGRGPY